jgi:hypothetical protein
MVNKKEEIFENNNDAKLLEEDRLNWEEEQTNVYNDRLTLTKVRLQVMFSEVMVSSPYWSTQR